MTYFLVCNSSKETPLRAIYASQAVRQDGDGENETLAPMVKEATVAQGGQGRVITGTSRADAADVASLNASSAPWLSIVEEWPADWVYPPRKDGP